MESCWTGTFLTYRYLLILLVYFFEISKITLPPWTLLTCVIRADPPYTQNTQAALDPETPGGPLALKDGFILVSVLNLASSYENIKKKKKLKANRVTEEILFLERFPWAWFETEWNTDIVHSSILSPPPPPPTFLRRAPRSLGSALCVVVDRVRNSHVQFLFLTCYLVRKHTNISCSCYPGNQLSLNTKQHASSPETDCIKRMYMHQSSENTN